MKNSISHIYKQLKFFIMKTKQLVLALLAFAFTLSAVATEIPKMNVVALDETKAYMAAITSPDVASEVSIITENGEVVYYKKSKAAREFKSVLNLSQLEDGMYTIKLETGKVSAQRELEISQGKVAVQPLQVTMDPFFVYDGKMLRLTYHNCGKNDMSMLVYNGSQLVEEFELGDNFNIQRAFDLSKLVKGEFYFVLGGADRDYSYKISK